MLRLIALLIFLAFPHSLWSQLLLVVKDFPKGGVLSDSLVSLNVEHVAGTKPSGNCAVLFSSSPKGNSPGGRSDSLSKLEFQFPSGSNTMAIRFKPSDTNAKGKAQLNIGIHYAVVTCQDRTIYSQEFPLWVETASAPSIQSPQATESSSFPLISWTQVQGVPAYHLLLSDQPVNLSPESGGISGASIIWQAITASSSIPYGSADPSGTFSAVKAPPLSPGVPYYLVILNNYDGKSAFATSSRAQALRLFIIKAPAQSNLIKPINLRPRPSDTLRAPRDSIVYFSWTDSTAKANTYHVFLYSEQSDTDVKLLTPIWENEVTDTSVTLNAASLLLSKRYVFRVFAVSQNGLSLAGDTSSFQYINETASILFSALELGPKKDSLALPNVKIELQALSGGGEPVPLYTYNDGLSLRTLPVGLYKALFSKEGYESQNIQFIVSRDKRDTIRVLLARSACTVTGRVQDKNGLPIAQALITAASSINTKTVYTDAQGYFQIGLESGQWSLDVQKNAFKSPVSNKLNITSETLKEIGILKLEAIQTMLNGKITNSTGQVLGNAELIANDSVLALSFSTKSDDKGAFSLALSPGSYVITARKTGFVSQSKSLKLIDNSYLAFSLSAGASLLQGRVNAQSRPTEETLLSSPLSGARVRISSLDKNDSSIVYTDANGQFSFSLESGKSYTLYISKASEVVSLQTTIDLISELSTMSVQYNLQSLAQVTGSLQFAAGQSPPANSITVKLQRKSDNFPIGNSQVYPEANSLRFRISQVPDGDYWLSSSYTGFSSDSLHSVRVSQGIWSTGNNITLIAADRSLQINTTRAATALNANIEILAPIQKSIASGTIVTGLGTGWYSCNVIPADPAILNLRGMSFEIKSTTPKDTVVTLELPYSKPSQGIIIDSRHLAKLFINLDIYVDSALVFYGLGVPKLSAKIPKPFQASASVTIDPGAQGGVLSYYFVVYRGKQRYSNESPDRWFQESIKPDQGLYSAQTERDSLFIPLGAKTKVYLHGYDAGGNLLDSLIKTKGSIKWSKSNVTPFTISDTNQLSIEVQMASKTKNLLRKADTLGWKISLEGRTLAGRLWITLDSVGTVNKLTLRSLLSSNRELVGTNHFSIQTDGFDTSLSPPLELVTNPSYTLIPKEAGKIEGSAVTLDSNFIGQVRIMARHKNKNRLEITAELFPDKDSLKSGLNIGKALAPGDKARDYFHDSYLQIKIPSGFVEEPSLLWLKSQRISSSFISKKNWQAVSQPIELSVQSGKPLLKSATISLSPSNATLGRELEIQAFDLNNLRWTEPPQDTVTFFSAFNRPSLSAQTLSSQNYVYTLFAKSLNLQALRFEIVPNPFSPLVVASQDGNTSPGARITLEVESPNAANILANLRIYNMAGELVRILLNHSTLAKQSLEIYWDGKTETGLWARNGRYILALKLDDGKNKHFQQRSIVLFR